ncbi:DrmB family protein [Sphaerisporangium sp. NPDC004334]
MALRNGRTRRPGGRQNGDAEVTSTPVGAVRRGQMINTYGVGAMVALDDRSYIISGLDTWKVRSSDAIYEPRLERWMDVSHFQLPPVDNPSSGNGVKIRLFPEVYSCPDCKMLQEYRRFGSPAGKNLCGACKRPLVPSRFVIACENGHLDDFPYFEWVHKKTSPVETASDRGHRLSLHSSGRTASLRSVIVKCTCGVPPVSLEGAFGAAAMNALGIRCRGRRPWLGRDADQGGCTAVPRTLQRGSSATWFPINRSALSIPPWSESLQRLINPHYQTLKDQLDDGNSRASILKLVKNLGLVSDGRFTPERVLAAVEKRRDLQTGDRPDEHESFEPANRLRKEEYEQLYYGTGKVERGDYFECVPPVDPSVPLPYGIERSMLVKRLREVRVLESFTRVQMPVQGAEDIRNAALSRGDIDWLPAIEVSGEGVFLAVDEKRLREWERLPGPVQRVGRIRDNHTALLRRRAVMSGDPTVVTDINSPLRPRYVLLHTLAHILINEWTLESGYPAAALRERLYVSDNMAGVLIYTATSDSEGSLGGVVKQGDHRQLYKSLESALARASWCSQDPPCMESEARGVDSLNLAACYACVLLAEVSCEAGNVFLDRALLIGTPGDPSTGFFNKE